MKNFENKLQKQYEHILYRILNNYFIIRRKTSNKYNIIDLHRDTWLLDEDITNKEFNEELVKRVVDEYHNKYYPYNEKLIKQATRDYKRGDTVYFICGYSKKENAAFDRCGVYIKTINDVKTEKGGSKYYVSADNQIMFWHRVFDNLDEAIEECKKVNSVYNQEIANDEIYVVDNRVKVVSQLSLFEAI